MSSVFEKELQAVELEAVELKALQGLEAIATADVEQTSTTSRQCSRSSPGKKRRKRQSVPRLPLLHSLHYIALLRPDALKAVKSVVDRLVTITSSTTAQELIAGITAARYSGVLLDPSLASASDIETVKTEILKYPRPLVAYTPLTYDATERMVQLARNTGAQFVFAGSPFEVRALQRALLLAPHVEVAERLYAELASRLAHLGDPLCDTITRMIKRCEGPSTADAIVTQCKLNRRTVERRFAVAGLAPSRLFVATAQVVRAYSAITCSNVPMRRIASLLGYTTQRAMDCHLRTLLGYSSSDLREVPLSCEAAVASMAGKLVTRRLTSAHRYERNDSFEREASRPLTLLPAS